MGILRLTDSELAALKGVESCVRHLLRDNPDLEAVFRKARAAAQARAKRPSRLLLAGKRSFPSSACDNFAA